MLDLNHPMTEHIFAASGLEDSLMVCAQRMTLLPSTERMELLAQCLPMLDQMRRLNEEHFGNRPFLIEAIDEAQAALEEIAHLGGDAVLEDKSNGEGACSVCGTALIKFKPYASASRWIILCGHCDKRFMAAKAQLGAVEGFGTVFI